MRLNLACAESDVLALSPLPKRTSAQSLKAFGHSIRQHESTHGCQCQMVWSSVSSGRELTALSALAEPEEQRMQVEAALKEKEEVWEM